jgi:hypothetical protein
MLNRFTKVAGKSRFDCSEKKVKGAIHLPEQAILILQRKKITPNERKGGKQGAVKPGSARRKTKSKSPPDEMQVGENGGEKEEDRRRGSPARLQPRGFGVFTGAAMRRGKWVLLFQGRRQPRSVNCSLLSSINPPHSRGVVVAWKMWVRPARGFGAVPGAAVWAVWPRCA